MKVLITGGTGFLGQSLLSCTPEEMQLTFTGRNKKLGQELAKRYVCKFICTDLGETEKLRCALEGVNAVIHNAALSSPWGKRALFYQANVAGTQNLVKLARDAGVSKFVYVSSPSVYFNYVHKRDVRENDCLPQQFCNDYAWSKARGEEVVADSQMNHVIIRPRGLFGPKDTSVFPRIINLAATGRVSLPSRRNPIIDLTYVDNVAQAVWLGLMHCEKCSGEVFNITNGEPYSLKSILNMLFSELDMDVSYRNIPYPIAQAIVTLNTWRAAFFQGKEPKLTPYTTALMHYDMTLNIDKAKKYLGYKPEVTIEEGINRYAQWYRSSCA